MEPFTSLTGTAASLPRANVDTDTIIPSREMKLVSKSGLADGLFANWRYSEVDARIENPDFVLNKPTFRQASILVSGVNFGCGSSREHAVWALAEYGFRAILAPSFGSIFYRNCVRNGVLPVRLHEAAIEHLGKKIATGRVKVTVDLVLCQVRIPDGATESFEIDPVDRMMLLEGLDEIGFTMKRQSEIGAFEASYQQRRPWLFEPAAD